MTTIRDVLFTDVLKGGARVEKVEAAAERLAAALPDRPGVTGLAVAKAVMAKVEQLLNIEVSDVVVGAWRTRSALLEAARETAANPGTYRQVILKTYEFGWDHEVDLDVEFNRTRIARVTVRASVDVEITGLAATVHSGRISKVSAGVGSTVTAAVRVSAEDQLDVPVAKRTRPLDLTYELSLPGEGIPLVE